MPQADSISTTPVQTVNMYFPPADTLTCRESQAPSSQREKAICTIGAIPYTKGIEPIPRNELPGYNSGVMAILLGVFMIIALNFRHYTTFLKTFTQNLFSVRQRANVFDDHSTTNETRILVSLILLLCVCEGILLFTAVETTGIDIDNFAGIAMLSGVAATYYVAQLITYRTIGYVFTSRRRAVMWMKGFNASQSLLGITLAAPAVLALFNPGDATLLLTISACLYAIARFIFIYKGFKIFYNNSLALIYFILYLCSLEIIPIILIYKTSIILSSYI